MSWRINLMKFLVLALLISVYRNKNLTHSILNLIEKFFLLIVFKLLHYVWDKQDETGMIMHFDIAL